MVAASATAILSDIIFSNATQSPDGPSFHRYRPQLAAHPCILSCVA
jgi:hypothetical protein